MTVLIVTGTGTDVGKTVATAAIAACAKGSVAVVKPAQTGVAPGEPGDLAEVTQLSKVSDTFEFARYPDPLSPHHAAQVSGLPELAFADLIIIRFLRERRHGETAVEPIELAPAPEIEVQV